MSRSWLKNITKVYNQLLELNSLNEFQRTASLKGVFNRDITNNANFSFRRKKLNPTPAEGQDTMERLFRQLLSLQTRKQIKESMTHPGLSAFTG